MATITNLKCEYRINPLGIDVDQPHLSWQMQTDRHAARQTAYHIIAASNPNFLSAEKADCWDSGKIESDQSVHIPYMGQTLASRQRVYWQVRVWDEIDQVTGSEVAWFEMGLLEQHDWQAQWIEPVQIPAQPEPKISALENLGTISPQPERDYSHLNPCQYLRKGFSSEGTIAKARIYATAHGVYRLEINGVRVGDQELAPEATAYDSYLQYQTYDVTEMIQSGVNVVGAVLADGWYCGRLGLPGDSCQYGDRLALLLQLEIEYADGSREYVVSDAAFKSATGALEYSDLFIGERYDANLEHTNWQEPDFDDDIWQNVIIADYGHANLVAQYGEPLRVVKEITPVAILNTPGGETVIDLGQTISGRIRMRAHTTAKAKIVLDHAEMLDADGNFFNKIHGRNKDQRDVYIAKGAGVEQYEPWFTTHGFRYVRLTGYPGKPSLEDFTGLVIASDLRDTGHFSCSDERINRLQENIRWSQRSNLVSIPTDCPQRERAGFTGDAQIFVATACFNMDVIAFFTRWLRNLQIEQREDGQVPVIIPYWKSYQEMFSPLHGGSHSSAGWGDACIIVPWVLYQSYGDVRVLQENYSTMVRWLDYVQKEAEQGIPEELGENLTPQARGRQKYLWNTGFHFGDWLIPSLSSANENPFIGAALTRELVACCSYAYSTELLAMIARLLGKENDYQHYLSLNAKIREAFAEEYVSPNGRLPAHYQGMYVLALKMKMVPAEKRPLLVSQLVELIVQNGYKLDTGFVSVPYLLDVLCDNGRMDIAHRLLFQTECPSWLYEVEQGATTMWERWDAVLPDGQVSITSFNHYAFGCVGDWMYRVLAGLDKDQVGYKHIVISPNLSENLTYARASYQSIYGEIISAWEIQNDLIKIQAVIPPNTTATIRLPRASLQSFPEVLPAAHSIKEDGQDVIVEVGSGSYAFEYSVAFGD